MNTCERLRNPGLVDIDDEDDWEWEILAFDDTILTPRSSPIACAINTEEIAIFGGYKNNDAPEPNEWYGDLILFNTVTEETKRAVENDSKIAFFSYQNQAVSPFRDTVVALV